MSVPVQLEALWERTGEFGAVAFLITVGPDSSAHVVSVVPRVADDAVTAGAGGTTRANVAANPAVTLLWPPVAATRPEEPDYSLIVDGMAEVLDTADGEVAVRPTRAVLHRIAGTAGDGPGCVPVLPAD